MAGTSLTIRTIQAAITLTDQLEWFGRNNYPSFFAAAADGALEPYLQQIRDSIDTIGQTRTAPAILAELATDDQRIIEVIRYHGIKNVEQAAWGLLTDIVTAAGVDDSLAAAASISCENTLGLGPAAEGVIRWCGKKINACAGTPGGGEGR